MTKWIRYSRQTASRAICKSPMPSKLPSDTERWSSENACHRNENSRAPRHRFHTVRPALCRGSCPTPGREPCRSRHIRMRSAQTQHSVDPRRARNEDLSMNMPPEPQDPELLERMRDGLATVSANLISLLRYQSTTGGEQDKAAASSWLSKRGMVPSHERIAITPGAHATMTAILSTMTRPEMSFCARRSPIPPAHHCCSGWDYNL